MRILWVKMGGLWPLNTGGRLRSFHIISELSERHRVTLLTTHGPGDEPEGLRRQLPRCEQVVSLPHAVPKSGSARFAIALLRSWLSPLPVDLWKWRVAALRDEVSRLVRARAVDLCVADFLFAVPNVPLGGPVPVIFFAHNVEHMIWKRLSQVESSAWRRALLELEWRKARRCEARACARARLTIAVSAADRALLGAVAPGARVGAIPTGVDLSYFAPNGTGEAAPRLAFTGSMDWYPNEDAVLYFMDAILPRIRHEMPQVSLTVVGRNPTARLRAVAAEAGVRVTGTVADVRPYVAEAAIYVVPLRVGGGTRLKIFEALAMGKAVVSTGVGAEGLDLVPGTHFLRADDPAEFARAVVSLLRDPVQRKALGTAGRRLVEQGYSWSHVARAFEARCEEVVTAHDAE
ncbi:MAG: glycosyltransferase [Candidatus Rokubacteria bacterium]|nr:glycosyltransferase [Candidatus Rokubacteria bacterium]